MTFDDALRAYEEQCYEEALGQFQALAEADPHNPDLHYNIACCFISIGNADEARDALHRAILINPAYRFDALGDSDLRALFDGNGRLPPEETGAGSAGGGSRDGYMTCPSCGKVNGYNNWRCLQCGTFLHPEGRSTRQPLMSHYHDYMLPAILCTLFCCLPTGMIAIAFAWRADASARRGDMVRAVEDSRNARAWFWISIILGFLFAPIYLSTIGFF